MPVFNHPKHWFIRNYNVLLLFIQCDLERMGLSITDTLDFRYFS